MGCKGSKAASAAPAVVVEPQAPVQKKGELPPGTEVLFVLGGPGSGKGTQCDRIVAKYGLKHLSAGDLLRDEVKSKSALGLELESIMKEGKLVPQETTIALLRKAMVGSGCDKFLVDGFPRALDQAKTFEKTVCLPRMVLFFDCPLETMEERLLSRGKTSGRSDDNAETIKKRFKTFQEQSLPVVEHYEAQGKVKRISAVPAPDEVFVEVERALDALQAQAAGESRGAAQVAAMAASNNPAAAEAIAAETKSQAVGAMRVEPENSTVPAARVTDSGATRRVTNSGATTRVTDSGAAPAARTTDSGAAAPRTTGDVRELKQRPSFVGIDDPELEAKIQAATQTTILGTTQGRLEDSDAKALQPDAEVAVLAGKMSTDGGKTVLEMPADATSSALPAAA